MASKSVEEWRIKWFSILKRRSQISEANKVSTTRRRNEVTKYLLQNKKRFWQVHSDEGLIFHNWTFKTFATNLINIHCTAFTFFLFFEMEWQIIQANQLKLNPTKFGDLIIMTTKMFLSKWNSKPCFIMPTIAEVNNIVANTGTHPDRISESLNLDRFVILKSNFQN